MVHKRDVANSFGQKHSSYISNAIVQTRIAKDLITVSTEYIKNKLLGADFGAGPAVIQKILQDELPQLRLFNIDLAEHSLAETSTSSICADFDHLPVRDNVFDFAFSSSALQWSYDAPTALEEIMRSVKSGGVGCFALFTDGTLGSLSTAQENAGIKSPVHYWNNNITESFLLKNKSNFSLIFTKQKNYTQEYDTAKEALNSISNIGASPKVVSHIKNSSLKTFTSSYMLNSRTANNTYQNKYNVQFLLLESL